MMRIMRQRKWQRPFYHVVVQAEDRQTRLRDKRIGSWPHRCGLQYMRDGGPHLELSGALSRLGLRYEGIVFDYPGSESQAVEAKAPRNAVFVFGTRPELELAKIKPIKVSGSVLEQRIYSALGSIFLECTRECIHFAPEWARQLPPDWAAMSFTTGSYAKLKGRPRFESVTAGYIIWLPNTGPRGQSALLCFGMGATEALMWSHLVRVRHIDVLKELLASTIPHVVVGRFSLPSGVGRLSSSVPADLKFSLKCATDLKHLRATARGGAR